MQDQAEACEKGKLSCSAIVTLWTQAACVGWARTKAGDLFPGGGQQYGPEQTPPAAVVQKRVWSAPGQEHMGRMVSVTKVPE